MGAGRPLPGKAPSAPTPASQRRETDRSIEQIDRRLNRTPKRREPVIVGPDDPGWAVGRLWYDTSETP